MQFAEYTVKQVLHNEPAKQIYLVQEAGTGAIRSLFCFDYGFACTSPGMQIFRSFSCCGRFCVVAEPFEWTLEKFARLHEGHPQLDRFAAQILRDMLLDLQKGPFHGFSTSNVLVSKSGSGVRARLGFNIPCDIAFKAVDGAADQLTSVWGAGIALYHVLVGRSPYQTRMAEEIEERIKFHDLAELPARVNPVFRRLLGGMLMHEQGRRTPVEKLLQNKELLALAAE